MTNFLIKLLLKSISKKNFDVSLTPPKMLNLSNRNIWLSGCQIKNTSLSAYGYGVDKNKDLALLKALMESLERIAQNSNVLLKINGIAANFTYRRAFKKAYAEMIERDAYIRCFLKITKPIEFKKINEILIFTLPTADSSHFCSLAVGEKGNIHPFGMGCATTQKEAEDASLMELAFLTDVCESNNFFNKTSFTPHKHALEISFVQQLTSSEFYNKNINKEFKYNHFKVEGLHKKGIIIVGITSTDLFQWDPNWLNKISRNKVNDTLYSKICGQDYFNN